jgi:hypothetical protein
LLILVYWGYRHFTALTPVQKIDRLLQAACDAVEAESILKLGDVLAFDFQAEGGVDRAAVIGQAQRFFAEAEELSAKPVHVTHEDSDPAPEAVEAEAIVVLRVNGRQTADGQRFSGIGGQGGDAFRVRFALRNGDWKIVHAARLRGATAEALLKEFQ